MRYALRVLQAYAVADLNYDGARVRAGDLRQSLAFYSPNLSVDSYGARVGGWAVTPITVFGNLWAEASPLSAESLNEQSNSAVVRATAQVRAVGVTPLVGWSVVVDSKRWEIKSVRDPIGIRDSWILELVYREEAP